MKTTAAPLKRKYYSYHGGINYNNLFLHVHIPTHTDREPGIEIEQAYLRLSLNKTTSTVHCAKPSVKNPPDSIQPDTKTRQFAVKTTSVSSRNCSGLFQWYFVRTFSVENEGILRGSSAGCVCSTRYVFHFNNEQPFCVQYYLGVVIFYVMILDTILHASLVVGFASYEVGMTHHSSQYI